MPKRMLINVLDPTLTRIAVVNNGFLEEFYIQRGGEKSQLNNIYKGRVVNVEPSIGAAFVDFGGNRHGFLHISDLQPPEELENPSGKERGKKKGRHEGSKEKKNIQELIKKNQDVVVQVTKEGIGHKGPTLTTFISIPGRYLVLMPSLKRMGVSRKISDEGERKRLKGILTELNPHGNMGFIVRTAGVGRTKREFSKDLQYLIKLWQVIQKRIKSASAPSLIYQESDLAVSTIRDIYSPDIREILVDSEAVFKKCQDFLRAIIPRSQNRIRLFSEKVPLFHKYRIEGEMEKLFRNKITLKSGGSIVIDQAEALVAIDVNSGRFKEEEDLEETAFKINMEAVPEITRQLRLRDLGGLIITDFIDMEEEKHRRELEKAFRDALRNDRARIKVARMSPFGIIEMTRQRLGPGLKLYFFSKCPICSGSGAVMNIDYMGLNILRVLQTILNNPRLAANRGECIEIAVNSSVAEFLLNNKRAKIVQLEKDHGKSIVIKGDTRMKVDEKRIFYYEDRMQKELRSGF